MSSGNISPPDMDYYSRFISYLEASFFILTISFVIFGLLGFLLSEIIGNISIQTWTIILVSSIFGALLTLLYFKPCPYVKRKFSIKNIALGLLPFLFLLPAVYAFFSCPHTQLSAHGPFHTAYILQIINGSTPPENVVLPGFAVNVYWLYHALLAVLVYVFDAPTPFVSAVVNMLALVISIYWIGKATGLTNLSSKSAFVRSSYTLLILFGTNLFGSIHVVLRYLYVEILAGGGYSVSEFLSWITYRSMLLAGDYRLINLAKKFFNFNGMPIGIMYLCFTLYISIRVVKGELSTKNILLLVLSACGALMFHTTTGVFIISVIPLSILGVLLYSNKTSITDYIRSTKLVELTALFTVSLVLIIPSIIYVYEVSTALPAKTRFGATISYNLISIFSAAYPLIPISIVAILLAIKKNKEIIPFLTAVSALGYIFSIILSLPDYNQYKFILSSTIALGFLCVIGLDYIYYNLKGTYRPLGRLIFIFFFIILGSNILLSGFGYIKSDRYGSNLYSYNDRRIELRDGAKFEDEFDWIRENTAEDTIVIMPFPTKNTGRDEVVNGNVYVIAERLPYVAYGHIFATGMNEYKYRKKNIRSFYSPDTTDNAITDALANFKEFSQKRDSVILVPKENISKLSPYLQNLNLLFRGGDAEIYQFKSRE